MQFHNHQLVLYTICSQLLSMFVCFCSTVVHAQTSAELCSVWPGAQARCTTQLPEVTFKEQDHSVSKLLCTGI
jgi:hypothetical protein